MAETQPPSIPAKIGGLLLFVPLTIISFPWFLYGSYQLIAQLVTHSPVITFDNSVIAALGVGIGMATLSFIFIYGAILKLKFPNNLERKLSKILIAGLLLVFLLPKGVHYLLDEYLVESGYRICPYETHRWMQHLTIVYASNPSACAALGD